MLLEKDELLRPEKVVSALAGIAGVDASRLDVVGMERVSRDGEGDANLGTEVLLALRAHTHGHSHMRTHTYIYTHTHTHTHTHRR